MDIKLIKQELDKLNQIIDGWEDNKSAAIEQDIALELLKKIYSEIKFTSPAAPIVHDTKQQEELTTDTANVVVEPQVEVEFIFDEDDTEPEPEGDSAAEVESAQHSTSEEATPEEEKEEEVVFEQEHEEIVFEDESEEIVFEEDAVIDEEEMAFKEEDEEEMVIYSDEEEIILEEEEKEKITPSAQPAKNQSATASTTSIGNLFGEEEEPQATNRTKHQRMMSIYNDYEQEEPSIEQSVDISKIFELDDDEEFIIEDGSDEEEFVVVNHSPSIAETQKQNDQGTILADVIAPAQPTIADSIEAPTAIADEMTNAPLKSLRDGIGINDKFLMIRDLFEGDADEYERVIEQLDSLSSFDDCMIYIVENFAWNPESDGAKFIMKLLERKLA